LKLRSLSNAEGRWARIGPYYAMFPLHFVEETIKRYTKPGDVVLDPFAGRFTSVYVAAALGRPAVGIEISPIGWVYGSAKLSPPPMESILKRLEQVHDRRDKYTHNLKKIPTFYRMCYCVEVLRLLIAAREMLNWKNSKVDACLMCIILVYLHGKIGQSLSNQMQISKSMGVNYSLNWWQKNKLETPPEINPFEYLSSRIRWRYRKGIPVLSKSEAILGDSRVELNKRATFSSWKGKFTLLLTSPPYQNVTDYYTDQWLRMWMLGGPAEPIKPYGWTSQRYKSRERYVKLLDDVFSACSKMMNKRSIVYVRTDSREFTLNTTLVILKKYFPEHFMEIFDRPYSERTQTIIMGNVSKSKGEVDIVLKRQ